MGWISDQPACYQLQILPNISQLWESWCPTPADFSPPAAVDPLHDTRDLEAETPLGLDPFSDIYSADTDKDGLTDREEVKIYFTDPLNPDSDNDGLNDYEEVMIWHTDPNNPDTDGDGYSDGEEVANGYDPLGPGKLVPENLIPTN